MVSRLELLNSPVDFGGARGPMFEDLNLNYSTTTTPPTSTVGAGSVSAALGDDSDSSYIIGTGSVQWASGYGTLTKHHGRAVKKMEIHARALSVGGVNTLQFFAFSIGIGGGATPGSLDVPFTTSGSLVHGIAGTFAPSSGAWTPTEVNTGGLQLGFYSSAGGAGSFWVSKLWLRFWYAP